tara:strand:- start:310 stop:1092 length:783 start_codon:yes stop_codon:yes gene_type:complete
MNFEGCGSIVAVLKDDNQPNKKKWKQLYITDRPQDCAGDTFREIKLKDKPHLHFQPVPDKSVERNINYITGSSGSGKSYYTRMYVDEYKRIHPKREVYLISSLPDDSSIDKIKKLNRINLTGDFMRDEVTAANFKDSCIIFDDCDVITDRALKNKITGLQNSCLEIGRHHNVECVVTSHIACDGLNTKRILNECKSIVIFPSGLGGRSLKYLLEGYFGLDREQIKKIKGVNSRWVSITKTYPMVVVSDKEAFLLNTHDDP